MRFIFKAFLLLLITNTYNSQFIAHRRIRKFNKNRGAQIRLCVASCLEIIPMNDIERNTDCLYNESLLMDENQYKLYYNFPFTTNKTKAKIKMDLKSTVVTAISSTQLVTRSLRLYTPILTQAVTESTIETDPNINCTMYCPELECKQKNFRFHNHTFTCEASCPNISTTQEEIIEIRQRTEKLLKRVTICNKKYLIFTKTVKQVEAHKICNAYNATLLEIATCSELSCIMKYIEKAYVFMQTQAFWTSGTVGGCAGRYTWCPSGRLVSKHLKWQKTQPNDDSDADQCIAIERSLLPKYLNGLNDQSCSNSQMFICDVPETRVTEEKLEKSLGN